MPRMLELIRNSEVPSNLMQSAAAKYSGGILLLGESRFNEKNLTPVFPARSVPVGRAAAEMILAEF